MQPVRFYPGSRGLRRLCPGTRTPHGRHAHFPFSLNVHHIRHERNARRRFTSDQVKRKIRSLHPPRLRAYERVVSVHKGPIFIYSLYIWRMAPDKVLWLIISRIGLILALNTFFMGPCILFLPKTSIYLQKRF